MFNSSIYYFQSTYLFRSVFLDCFFYSDASNLELINIRKLTFGISQIEYRLKLMNNIYNKNMKYYKFSMQIKSEDNLSKILCEKV